MKRRANGEGSVTKRKDGRWQARLTLAGGKRLSVYGRTRADVVRKLNTAKAALEGGTLSSPSAQTLSGWLEQWLDDVHRHSVAASTLGLHRSLISTHVAPHLGDRRLTHLRAEDFDWLLSELGRNRVGDRVRQQVHGVLSKALRKARNNRKIQVNPMEAVERPRAVSREIRAFAAPEIAQVLEAAKGSSFEALYVLASYSGMRWGELAGLKWGDVDLERQRIAVRRTLREVYAPEAAKGQKWRFEFAEPKTRTSRRSIRVGSATVRALEAHRARLGGLPLPSVLVFTAGGGRPLRRSNFRRREWLPLLAQAELPAVGFHTLRHSMATLGLTQGLNPKIVQERLGHSRVSQTLDTYSHVVPELHLEAADLLESSVDASLTPTGVDKAVHQRTEGKANSLNLNTVGQ